MRLHTNKFCRQGLFLLISLTLSQIILAQTDLKIGSSSGIKNTSAVLELESTNKGFLLPRLTTAQMNAIAAPANGLSIYNTNDSCVYIYRNSLWMSTCSPSYALAWGLLGNSGTTAGTNFIGTTDAQALAFRTNNAERMRLTTTGNLGLGTTTPTSIIGIDGTANQTIKLERNITAGTIGRNLTILAGGATTGGTNLAGGNLVLSSGTATGSAGSIIIFNTATGGTAGTTDNSPNEQMRLTGAGFLGINTNNPAYRLDVNAISGSSGNPLRLQGLQAGATTDSLLSSASGIVRRMAFNDFINSSAWGLTGNSGTTAGTNFIGTTDAQALAFRTNNTEQMRLTTTGNLGLGTTTPTSIIGIDGTAPQTIKMERNTTAATVGRGLTISAGGATTGGTDLNGGNLLLTSGIATGTGTSNIIFSTATAGATGTTDNSPNEQMRLTGTGFLGINTNNPTHKLDIDANSGSSGNPLRLRGLQAGAGTDSVLTSLNGIVRRVDASTLITTANNAWLIGGNTLTGMGVLGTNSNHAIELRTNNTTRLTIGNGGAITQTGTGLVTFTGNVNATNGLDVTTAALNANAGSTLTGTVNINATGTAATTIGSATSMVNVAGNTLNVTNTPTVTTVTGNSIALLDNSTGRVRNITASNLMDNITADNGLTKNTNTNIRLGGTLLRNTDIAQAGFDLNFSGGSVAIGTATAPTSTFQLAGSMSVSQRQVTANTTLAATDFVVLANATASGFTLTLPAANTCSGRTYYICKIDESSNTVTFSPALRLTVTSSISAVNYPKKFRIVSDGTDWWIYSE
jgi:hypothetical protein